MNATEIRAFLLANPKPNAIRLTCEEDVHDVAITKGGSWLQLAQSVSALRPDLIEALDASGKLLRAVRPAEFDLEQAAGGSSSSSSSSAPLPAGGNDHTTLLREFGRELANAYRHANEVAFTRMVDMFEAVNRRSETLEKSLDATHKMLRRAWEDQLEARTDAAQAEIESQKDPLSTMAAAFMQGAAASVVPKTNGTNGAAGAPNGKA